jgi:hypothetical protein
MIKMVSITSAIDREIIESVPSDCGGRYGYIDFIVWIDHGSNKAKNKLRSASAPS